MKNKHRILFIFLFIVIILAPRSNIEMLYKAKKEFNQVLTRIDAPVPPSELMGPITKKSNRSKNEYVFKWYKPLPYYDTAWVNIYVPRFRFKFLDVTMSNSTDYLFSRPNNLYTIFPTCENSPFLINTDSVNNLFNTPDFTPIVSKEKLLYILQNGYYDVFRVNNELSVIAFWEPIGILNFQNQKVEAKFSIVDLDEKCIISIKPFLLPDSIKNYLINRRDGIYFRQKN